MYFPPEQYRCEAGHEFGWSPHDEHRPAWLSTIEHHPQPVCPTCWNAFLVRERLLLKVVRKNPLPDTPKSD
jgi:hypothetical protein